MSTFIGGIWAGFGSIRDRWVELVAGAMIIAAGIAAVVELTAPSPPTWVEWIIVRAYYQPATHSILVARTREMHEPCPASKELRRELTVYDEQRQPYVFWTESILAPDNEPGVRTTLRPLVVHLRDVHGARLDMTPQLVSLTLHCPGRASVMSPVVRVENVPAQTWDLP